MPKFEVTALEQIKYLIEVEAETADEAEAIAKALWAQSLDPMTEFSGEGYGIDVTHVLLDGLAQPDYAA